MDILNRLLESWIGEMADLNDGEIRQLNAARAAGFLHCTDPIDLLGRSYHLVCTLEDRVCVMVQRGAGVNSRIIVSLPNLNWFPAMLVQLGNQCVYVERVALEHSLVTFRVPNGVAEGFARTIAGTDPHAEFTE